MRALPTLLLFLLALAWPAVAFAAGGGQDGDTLAEILFLLLVVGAAYLLANVVVGRLQRRFLVLSGVEYIALGVLLGPSAALFPMFEDLTGTLPVVALATGWIGLLRGMELSRSSLRAAPRGTKRLAVGDSILTGGAVAAGAYGVLMSGWLGSYAEVDVGLAAACLGCGAATRSTGSITVILNRYRVSGPTASLLRSSAKLGDAVAFFAFGMVFASFHEDVHGAPVVLDGWLWAALSLALGAALGLLFRPFLGADDSENSRFLALVGTITFASGAGWFLSLSPLFINLILGAVLVNTTDKGAPIRETLQTTERPMSIVLMIFVGILWKAPPPDVFLALLAVILTGRFVGKWVASRIAAAGGLLRHDLYRGQLGHGNGAIVMSIGAALVFQNRPLLDAAISAVLVSFILHNIVAPRALRALLVDSGEIKREADR